MAKMTYAEFLSDRQKNPNKYRVQQPQAQQRQTMEDAWDRFSAAQAGASGPQTVAAPGGLANQQISFYNNAVPSINAGIAKQNVAAGAANQRISFLNNMVPGINREIAKQNINGAAGNQQVSFFNNSVPGMNREIAKQNIQADAANQRITFFNNAVPGINTELQKNAVSPYNNTIGAKNLAGNLYAAGQKGLDKAALKKAANRIHVMTGNTRSAIDSLGGYATDWNAAREMGLNDTNKPILMSDEQLKAYNEKWAQEYAESLEKEKGFQLSPEKQAEENERYWKDRKQTGIWQHLSQNGVPYGKNAEGQYVYTDIEDWQGLNEDEWLKARPDDYYDGNNRDSEGYDQAMYDAVYGRGAYEARLEALETDEDVEALEAELDAMWDELESGGMDQKYSESFSELTSAQQNMMGYYGSSRNKRYLDKGTKEQARRNLVNRMEAEAPDVSGTYHEKFEQTGSRADEIYQTINNATPEMFGERITYNSLKPEYFMTADQREVYNRYYNAGMKDEAMAYYEGLKPALDSMMMTAKDQFEYDLAMKGDIGMIAHRIITQPVAGVTGTLGATMALLGNEAAQDEDNPFFYGLTRKNQNIQAGRGQAWGNATRDALVATEQFIGKIVGIDPKLTRAAMEATGITDQAEAVGQWTNGMFYSIADNIVARTIGMGIGGVVGAGVTSDLAGGIIQLIMSSEATANEMVTDLRNGMDPTESAMRAITSGVIEWITEKYSTDRFFENYGKGSIWNQVVANIIPEAQEEGASKILETLVDIPMSRLFGHKTELEEAAARYMEDYNMDETEAWKMAMWDWTKDLGSEMLAGGISGGLMGGEGAIQYNFSMSNIGKSVSSNVNTSVEGVSGQRQLVETAAKMDGTQSQEKAEIIMAKEKEGMKVSNFEVGELAATMMQETGESFRKVSGDTMERIVKDQLRDAGVRPEIIDGIAAAFRRSAENGWKLSREDQKIIAQSSAAVSLWKSYNMKGAAGDLMKGALKMKTQEELKGNPEAEKAKSVANIIGDLTNRTTAKMGSALAADIRRISRTAKNIDEAIDQLAEKRSALISDEFANLLKEIAKENKDNSTLLDDAMRIMLAAKTMRESIPKSRMDKAAAQRIWDQAKAEFDEEEAKRVQNYQIAKPGEGTAEFEGAKYGTQAWTDKLKGVKGPARVQMAAIAEIAKTLGQNVRFINDTRVETDENGNEIDHRLVHGWEDNATGAITVNIAGMQFDKTSKNMMVTVAHEMTHWLEQNSREGYAQLRQFILDNLRAKGVNVEDMLIRRIDNQNAILGADSGESLTIDGALAEIVAESCEGLLGSREMMNRLAKENRGLYQKVKNFVRDLISKINRAIAGMSSSMSAEARLLENVKEDLARIWLQAREEAMNRTPAEAAEAEEGTGRSLSVAQKGNKNTEGLAASNPNDNGKNEAQYPSDVNIINENEETVKMDKAYREAVERGDLKTATNMLMEKFRKTAGVIPFMAPHWNAGKDMYIAENIKYGDPEVIAKAAKDMAEHVPDNAVLIPMPDHTGKVNENSGTMLLANAISEITGRPVVTALEGADRESRRKAKHEGRLGVNQEEIGFRQVKEIPEGTFPVFIDNMVGSGVTADAARIAMGGGITLAYAKSVISKGIKGLKNLIITYDKNKNLIPLSERMNVQKREVRYSVAQQDSAYMDAVERGDMETAQQMVDEAANAAMPDSKIRDKNGKLIKVYHNTDAEFTVFMPETKGGKTGIAEGYGIYLTDDPATAENYGTRQIAGYVNITRPAYGDRRTIKRAELIKLIKASAEYHADDMQLEYEMLGEESVSRKDLLKDTWVSNYANTYGVTSMDKVYAEVADNILNYNDNDQDIVQEIMAGMAIRDYFRAMDFYNKVLTPTTGIDGIWAVWENKDKGLKANVFLAFDSSQIKEADPVTYDDDGNIIPLSERFNKNNKDIRYSVAQRDKAYQQAIEDGDEDLQQYYVNQAAEKAGYTETGYHGSPTAGFTIFNMEDSQGQVFFAYDKNVAETYTTNGKVKKISDMKVSEDSLRRLSNKELIQYAKENTLWKNWDKVELENGKFHVVASDGIEIVNDRILTRDEFIYETANMTDPNAVYELFVRPGKQLVIDAEGNFWHSIPFDLDWADHMNFDESYDEEWEENVGNNPDGMPRRNTRYIARWAMENGYDSVRINNVHDSGAWGKKGYGDIGIVFNSNDVKSADPVVYDDNGNVIPLSERFNKSNKDIRYSVATDVQEMTNGQAQEAEAENSGHPLQKQFSLAQLATGAGLRFDEYNLKIYDKDGNEIDGVKNKVTPEMVDGMPFGRLISTAMNGMMTKKKKVILPQMISTETAQAQKKMLADLLNMVAQYKNSNLVWEVSSSMLFSALKSNSDPQYNTTVDFGTVCAKTQEIINVMSRVMLEKGRGLTRNEVLKVYNETAKAGLTVPCPVCYVFSRWMGVPSLLGQMSGYQKRFVVMDKKGENIDRKATQAKVDAYIREALEKYGDKSGIDSAKTSLQNKIGTQEKNREEALKVMLSETATDSEKAAAKQKHDDAVAKLDEMTKDLGVVEAYNWVTQALCKETKKGSGKYVVDPAFRVTPDSTLFDLRKTGEFAKFTKNWKYRNTRGAGMGKAIMPYSGMSIGDIIYGTTRKTDANNPILADVNDSKNKRKIADGMAKAWVRARMQNLIGGQRLQSTSDFRPEWGLDYLMTFMELQAIGSKVQMYTKVAEAVPLLASMGADINLSIMGKGQGWHVDKNGKFVLDFSDVTGMDYKTAKALKNSYSNVQMILVGMNDTHIRLALADTDIDFVIPWHSSGNSKEVLSSLLSSLDQKLETSSDYTDTQSDAASKNQTEEQKKLWALRLKILRGQAITDAEMKTVRKDIYLNNLYERFNIEGVDPDCYQVKLRADQAKQIFPYEYWNKALTKDQANENGKNFIEYCRHFGITPRFSGYNVKDEETGEITQVGNFAGAVYDAKGNIIGYDYDAMADGYWKLLIDRPMYDNDGNYRDQQVVDVTQAKIGKLDKTGKLTGSDMPLEVKSALYGPKYSEQEKTAVDNALASIKYEEDLKAAGSSVYEGSTEMTAEEQEQAAEAAQRAENVKRSLSVAQPDMDVKLFMQGLNESSLTTAQERAMLRQFKELNAALDIARLSLTENNNTLRRLLAKQNPSAYDREEIRKAQNRITNDEEKIARLEKQMAEVTSEKGYAGLMYSQSKIMTRMVSGRSSDEVHNTVDALTKALEKVTREIKDRQGKLDALRADLSYRKTAALVDEKSADKVAAMIRKMFMSKIDKQDLMRALTEIRLKIETGQDIDSDVEELAWKIASGIATDGGESLRSLRGTTIFLGRGQVKELLGKDASLKELRSIFAGTGIKVQQAKDGQAGLDANWDELCDMIPELDRNAAELNQVDELIRFVQNQKRQMDGAEVYKDNIGEIEETVKAMAATIGTNTPKDPAAMKILNRMNALVNEMANGIRASEEEMGEIRKTVIDMIKQGKLAIDKNNALWNDIRQAITYNNLLTEQSEAAKWKNERWKLKAQLESEYTQKLIQEQEKWKQKIERDKTAREKMQSNLQLRKAITTNIGRLRGLLMNETDRKNIPEHMKGLARWMLEKVTFNDLYGRRKITGIDKADLMNMLRTLDAMKQLDGEFDREDLKLINSDEARDVVEEAIDELEAGIGFYNNSTGKDLISNLQAFHNALERIADAVAAITGVINSERTISFRDRQILLEDAAEEVAYDMRKSRFKGDWMGRGSKQISSAKRAVTWGNMTPVYFFRMLKNRGLDAQWNALKAEENRNGLEIQKAAARVKEIAEKAHYRNWAGQTMTVRLGRRNVEMTVDQMMALYAIWKREHTQNPEMSDHLYKGGVFIEPQNTGDGKLQRQITEQKPIRVSDGDVLGMYDMLTDEQKQYINDMVGYLSNEMSELGNDASMRMFGIKKYKEKWYFPMKVWNGVKSARSDKGINGVTDNRGAHKGWTKRRVNNAQNALVIGNFTDIAVQHIVEMINYNTVVPIVENINKILNYQRTEFDDENDEDMKAVKRNVRVMFQQYYGRDALNYIETFINDLNGGTVQDQRKTLREAALSMFKKNAVAGSMSVALQQPMSYIRAAMMINPKYLAQALSPAYWRGSYAEMMKYSGVAVIKNMGRFDMNFGRSARDFIAPELDKSVIKKISDATTALPELMDRMTWTRMWSAVKLEQHALHPDMDITSDEFLQTVAARFNDLMQRTQVYDSVMVKSQNMRSQKFTMKLVTSFMAEPTLTLNVLADAVQSRIRGDKGSGVLLAKAVATYMISALGQSFIKGLMGSGRTPDEKKTWLENFLNKWGTAFMSEVDPLNLVPGYSDIVELIKTGELSDDAMGAVGKIFSVFDKTADIISGNGKGWYRDLEDTAGQLVQLFTNIPMKNLMRDGRAMYNWISQEPYAKRPTSGAVLRYQAEANLWNSDTMMGAINAKLGDAGFRTTNDAYYGRMFGAMKAGNKQEAEDIREYLQLGKGVNPDKIDEGLRKKAKANLPAAEANEFMFENDMKVAVSTLTTQYKDGEITESEYKEMLKQADPTMTDDEIWWKTDRINWQKETGAEETPSGFYYRLDAAIESNNANEIQTVVSDLMEHGRTQKQILDRTSDWKQEYLEADSKGKIKIRDAIHKVYKAAGSTAEEADKKINKWK